MVSLVLTAHLPSTMSQTVCFSLFFTYIYIYIYRQNVYFIFDAIRSRFVSSVSAVCEICLSRFFLPCGIVVETFFGRCCAIPVCFVSQSRFSFINGYVFRIVVYHLSLVPTNS